MLSISHYLYSKFARSATATALAVFLPFTFAAAQMHTRDRQAPDAVPTVTAKKAKRGPRAIAVIEFLPNGSTRLVPIALWVEGRYYDASEYGANPEPMAVQPETVYEAQSFGEPTGTFTVTAPEQVNGNWVADGNWQPELPMDVQLRKKAAKDAASQSKNPPSAVVMTGDNDDGKPVLKRAPGSAGDSPSSGQTAPATTTSGNSGSSSGTSNDSNRPTLKRPASDSSSKPTLGSTDDSSSSGTTTTATTKSQPQVDDQDPNRPVMKRTTSPSAQPSQAGGGDVASAPVTSTAASSNDSDPNRPTLSRTKVAKPATSSNSDVSSTKTEVPFSTAAKGARAYPAISDAGDYESRSLIYSMSSGERQVQEQQMLKLALDEIRAFAAKHNGPAIPKTATITDYDVRAFDLEYSSSPTMVLTARLPIAAANGQPVAPAKRQPIAPAKGQPVANFTYFATIVARVDINDQAKKIFSMTSDTRHLDAYPRMELIDAIDADANGRGDLLFRQYSDVGISYGLYRVSAYQIEKIFEGGSSL
ncbi:MAG: hypothetical protein WBS19_03030 [Candidatus Korobacteraceae bacterium]